MMDTASTQPGLSISLSELLRLEGPARAIDISRHVRPALQGSGTMTSRFRGRGMEFSEVRAYQQGDDVRQIDWRVTARTQLPHTRLYREERGRPLFLLVDLSAPMFFGSRRCLKSVAAAETAALLAWAGLQHGDRVGGLLLDHAGHHEVRARRGRRSLLHLLAELAHGSGRVPPDRAPPAGNAAVTLLDQALRLTHPGSLLVLISDLQGFQPRACSALHRLAGHNELLMIRVSDRLERELPPPGRYRYRDSRHSLAIDSGSRQMRERFAETRARLAAAQQRELAGLGIPLLDLDTAQPPLAALQRLLAPKRQGRPHA